MGKPSSMKLTTRAAGLPVLTGSLLLGVVPELLSDPLALYQRAAALGDMVRLRIPLGQLWCVSSPELVQQVLRQESAKFTRPPALRRLLQSLGGDNLMTREGAAFLARRRMLTPSLDRAQVQRLFASLSAAIDSSLDGWQSGAPLALKTQLTMLTQEVVARTLLGTSVRDAPAIARAFSTVTDYIAYRATTPLAPPLWVPTARNRRLRSARQLLDQQAMAMLRERRAQDGARGLSGTDAGAAPDLLESLLAARDADTGEALSDEQICREIQVFIGAGESTTSEALTFCFSLLGRHPDYLARVVAELQNVSHGRPLTFSDLPRLTLLRQVLDETLRLYPPSYVLARAATEPTTLGGVTLPAGATVLFSPYVIHRDARFWSEPHAFRPERFAPGGEAASLARNSYVPFGTGPRRCIGENLAQVELMLAVARILQRFELQLPAGPEPALRAGFALSLRDELWVRAEPRTRDAEPTHTSHPA